MKGKFFNKFSVFDLVLLSLVAAAGIAVKPIVVSVSHLITGPLLIPGGALAGGFYMLFVVLGAALVGKRGSAFLICLVQCILVIASGVYGTHGIASLLTYVVPGLGVELVWLFTDSYGRSLIACFFGGIAANVTGVLLVNLVFFRLPFLPVILSAALAAFSGGIGGIIAWQIVKTIKKQNILSSLK